MWHLGSIRRPEPQKDEEKGEEDEATKRQVFMQNSSKQGRPKGAVPPSLEPVNPVFTVTLNPGNGMIDTGSRAAVGGPKWHRDMQRELVKRGRKFRELPQSEYFQFGPGKPIHSTKKWVYEVGILGEKKVVEISEVPAECPGLLGPEEMKLWRMRLDFDTDSVSVAVPDGVRSAPMQMSESGHPIIDMLEFDVPSKAVFAATRSAERERS